MNSALDLARRGGRFVRGRGSFGRGPATKLSSKRIEYRPGELATVLDIHGSIDGTSEARLRGEMESLIKAGAHQLILDCRDVDFINSSGLGAILMFKDELARLGGALVLMHMSERALMVIEMLGFGPTLDIAENEAQALELIADGTA